MDASSDAAAGHGLFDLRDHVALVTGGNGGIGLAMAEGLARAGASICIWGTNSQKTDAAAERIGAHGHPLHTRLVDVSDEQQVNSGFVALVEEFGKLNSCFANASLTTHRDATRFVDTTLEDWQAFTRVNLDGSFLTLRGAARQMISQGIGGSLVGTSSIAARIAAPRDEAYAVTKAGICALMRSLAGELGRFAIRCNTILPGWTQSPAQADWEAKPTVAKMILQRMPLGRWGKAEDWAGIAVYLASDASAFHTADEFRIDGGFAAC